MKRKSSKPSTKSLRRPAPSTDFFIVTETLASQFARSLQTALQDKVTERVLRSRFLRDGAFVVTPSEAVKDKLQQLTAFKSNGISCPLFAESKEALLSQGSMDIVFARTTLRGTQGEGIVQIDHAQSASWPRAPLYVEYIPKSKEYRFHVFEGQVIDVQEKRKKRDFDADERDVRIRNTDNGYAFCRGGVQYADIAATFATQAVHALSYSYGAVDIIYSKKRDQYFVLEVNSKPGMEGQTLDVYSNAIINRFHLKRKV